MTKISESQLVVPALKIMAARPDGFITTSDLIKELEAHFKPDGHDTEIIDGRSDTYFSQKVRNLVSHRTTSSSFIQKRYATYDKSNEGLTITDLGRQAISSKRN